MRQFVAMVVLAALVAGCTVHTPRPVPGPTASPTTTTTTTAGPTPSPPPSSSLHPATCPSYCPPRNLTVSESITVQGAAVVEAPFPHLDRCLSPDDWRPGLDPNLTLVQGERGWVLHLANASGQASIDYTAKPKCETFRFDPWSIDPDPTNATLDVWASAAAHVDVQTMYALADGWCWTTQHDVGDVGPGWTALAGTTQTVCA